MLHIRETTHHGGYRNVRNVIVPGDTWTWQEFKAIADGSPYESNLGADMALRLCQQLNAVGDKVQHGWTDWEVIARTEPIEFSEDEEEDDVLTAAKEYEEDYLPHFVHEDGSHTVIVHDEDPSSPRDDDGNVAHLVMLHKDYVGLDDSDSGIDAARDRWDDLTYNGHPHRSNRQPSMDTAPARLGLDREAMVKRYLAMFRPDIVGYEDRWEVTGNSQSDWAYGYAYVTREDWEQAFGNDGTEYGYIRKGVTHIITPDSVIEQEVKTYGLYFRGEVYGAYHLSKGEPIVALGEQGGYVVGHQVEEDAVWGFLGYEDLKDIAAQFTDSPVVEDVN